jgi:NADPH:quinone reductase-like Zn-dependent oxidoreductase
METMQRERPEKRAATMKAIRFHKFGGPEVLRYEDAPKPQAEPGRVLVRIKAASVNPIDWKIRAGYMKDLFENMLPMIPGVDMAGVIEAVGDGASNFKPGDEVFAFLGVAHSGTYAEYVAADASALTLKPESIGFTEAAATPLVSMVGWQTLFDVAQLKPDQSVLIHGAAGGVGHIAVQLAHWKGARIIGTASARNIDFVKSLGADRVIDYHTTRFEDVVHDVDVVLDTIGGDTQRRSYKVLKKGGVLVSTLGIEDPGMAEKYDVRAVSFLAQPDAEELMQVARLIVEGKIKPDVTHLFPLKDAAKAQELSETGHVHGKIVLKVSD